MVLENIGNAVCGASFFSIKLLHHIVLLKNT
jgi:hypothetical protein